MLITFSITTASNLSYPVRLVTLRVFSADRFGRILSAGREKAEDSKFFATFVLFCGEYSGIPAQRKTGTRAQRHKGTGGRG